MIEGASPFNDKLVVAIVRAQVGQDAAEYVEGLVSENARLWALLEGLVDHDENHEAQYCDCQASIDAAAAVRDANSAANPSEEGEG